MAKNPGQKIKILYLMKIMYEQTDDVHGLTLAQIAEERTDVVVGKVNVDDSMELARMYKVVSIPTLIVFKDGKASAQMVGFGSKQEILEMLK